MSVTALVQSMTVSEIKRVANDSQTPGFIAVVANAILGDIKNGEMKNTQFMLEFQHGKALQAIQMEKVVREDIIDPRQLSDEEIRQRLSELRERDIEERDFEEVI
jgi:deoxyribose-phosphate aldolase